MPNELRRGILSFSLAPANAESLFVLMQENQEKKKGIKRKERESKKDFVEYGRLLQIRSR